RELVPAGPVPMKLPAIKLFDAPEPLRRMPLRYRPVRPLPEITLPAPGSDPPTRLPYDSIEMPSNEFGTALVPAAPRPMKFPCTTLLRALKPCIRIPSPLFPEITLRAAALVPPIRLPVELLINKMP